MALSGLDRGSGVIQWEHDHQATPLSAETYLGPDFRFSVTIEQLADSSGNPINVAVIYDKQTNQIGLAEPAVASTPVQPQTILTHAATLIISRIFAGVDAATGQPIPDTNPDQSLIPTDARVRLVVAWIECEGGIPWNNPLNVASPLNGSWQWTGQTGHINDLGNGFGVARFDTLEHGCQACSNVIQQENMGDIEMAIINPNDQAFVEAISNDPWGTSPTCVGNLLRA